jgi:hypothetical protein
MVMVSSSTIQATKSGDMIFYLTMRWEKLLKPWNVAQTSTVIIIGRVGARGQGTGRHVCDTQQRGGWVGF